MFVCVTKTDEKKYKQNLINLNSNGYAFRDIFISVVVLKTIIIYMNMINRLFSLKILILQFPYWSNVAAKL
jgi:pantothenate kinase type III